MHGGLTTAEAFPAESAGGLEQALALCAAINLPSREVNRSQHNLQPLHADKMTSKLLGPTFCGDPNRTELEHQKLRIRSGGTATITFYRTD